MKSIASILLVLISSFPRAQTIFNETFAYGTAPGSLCGTGGVTTLWTPHSNQGMTPVMYAITSLSYTGYSSGASIGNGSVTFANGTSVRESVNRQIPLVNSGNLYIALLLKVTGATGATLTSDYVIHLSDTFGTSVGANSIARLFIKNQILLPTCTLGISKGSLAAGAVYTGSYTVNTTLLVIMKYMFKTGSATDDSLYAWVYSGGVPATEPAPQLVATDMTVNDLAQVRSVCIRQGNVGTSNGNIDVIRAALSWSSVLPVSWLNITAKQTQPAGITVKWRTATEVNNDYFVIERGHADGSEIKWTEAGTVKGKGNSKLINDYVFVDHYEQAAAGIFYRLKQIDFDGKSSWSAAVPLELFDKAAEPVRVYPNPFSGQLALSTTEALAVSISDVSGNQVLSQRYEAGQEINTAHLGAGVYLVQVVTPLGITRHKLVKH